MDNNELDQKIRNSLHKDQISDQQLFDNLFKYINNTNIKVSSFSYKKQICIIIVLIILIVLVCAFLTNKIFGFSYIFSKKPNTPKVGVTENIIEKENTTIENTLTENVIYENTTIEDGNLISDINENNLISTNTTSTIDNNSIDNNTTNQISNTVTNTTSPNIILSDKPTDFSNINTKELEKFISDFAIGIERLSFDEENLESNTILLYIAKHYFDTNNSKATKINSDYAASIENIHKYLTEFTGKDYTKLDFVRSYNNYIGYTSSSKAYIDGKNISELSKEKYSVSDLIITNEFNNVYTATAKVSRTLIDTVTDYNITFTFSVNKDFKYQEFCLKSLRASNISFYPDNTVHLVEVSN